MNANRPDDIRPAAMAGRFYPGSATALRSQVVDFLNKGRGDGEVRTACAAMVPHAGYVYSGGVAGQVFANIAVPHTVVVLCPNHTGLGARVSVTASGAFAIPGADIAVDSELARSILDEFPGARADREAHRHEHAIEVELPFLAARRPDVHIVPIVVSRLSEDDALELGRAIHRAALRVGAAPGRDMMVLASSDMSHFLPDAECRAVDRQALEPLLDGDASALYRTVTEREISMCGFIPTTAALTFARAAGCRSPELLGYATSGDAFGDTSRVVGYAGVIMPHS